MTGSPSQAATLLGAALLTVVTVGCTSVAAPVPAASSARAEQPMDTQVVSPLEAEALAALPEARYDAVIPTLSDASDIAPALAPASTSALVPVESTTVYSLDADAAIYGEDRMTPVARLPKLNFLGEPTVVVPTEVSDDWARVLLPSRQRLPSESSGDAPAQTSGWMRRDLLVAPVPLADRIVVSVSAQTLSIVSAGRTRTFPAGVGAPGTPTPTGVTGYLQARYLDPEQGQSEHRVQLTSLHSSASDEPFGGADGGLIGLHHADLAVGAVSHGCIRLAPDAIAAVDALSLGTSITVIP